LRAYQPDGVACISGPGSWPTLRKAGLLPGKTVRFIMLNKPNDDAYCAGVGVLPERLGEEAVFLLHAMLLRGEHGVPNQRKIVRLESTYSHGNSMELA